MADIRHITCEIKDCKKRPTFGYERGKALRCKQHSAGKAMFDVMNPVCSNCNSTTANRNYESFCAQCYFDLNPEAQHVINYKTKELAFTNAVKEYYPSLIQDRVIEGGSSRRRPDALLDVGTHCIIIEIDERQHSLWLYG
ncbi:hypothetical protein PPTG_14900 [Phytophthora nicotianae INRA-310]|uniref:Uncharacterized protein n=1 Tax=Phytophthora nicotianae (strain INRA-310) TaxID=761204 RepID=W2PVZ1_PHYN3|nr:hypothetical protein PPTG_14900 [Phytophthora nicotianae INRA-310]ETN04190.1 hypothetical protein PPTG_14900 [Phytophthora nicotianae INRA-310]